MTRIERFKTAATVVAGEVLTEALDPPVRLFLALLDVGDVQHAAAEIQAGFDGVGDAAALISSHHDSVDHDLNLVLAAVVDGRRLLDVVRAPIHPQPHEAAATNFLPERFVLLLSAALHWSHDVQLRPFRQGDDLADNLVGRLRADGNLAVRARRLAEAG